MFLKTLPAFAAFFIGLFLFITLEESSLAPALYNGRIRPLESVEKPEEALRIPAKKRKEWLPLAVFQEDSNRTAFSDAAFQEIKRAPAGDQSSLILNAYLQFREGTSLPTLSQLKAELFYLRYNLLGLTLIAYAMAAVFYVCRKFFLADSFFILALFVHTALLALRVFILGRPPVSNMQETVLFVPWVGSLLSLLFLKKFKNRESLLSASLLSITILTLGMISFEGKGLEIAPAVLNSRFWLMIHVLMVVSSYAFFLLAGILAHVHLITKNKNLSDAIMILLYAGTFFLISGTILGGLWAQSSWGRFWDWDPKEAWAFISSCLYLILIHLYRFGYIDSRGVSCGSIIGVLSIGFTWYGVNYLLGTGLHSYGFGSGGALWFILYVLAEFAFLLGVFAQILAKKIFLR